MNTIDQELINVRADEKLDLNKLKTYLKNELDYSFDNIEILQFSGGHANLTYLLQLDNKEYVLSSNISLENFHTKKKDIKTKI